MKKLNKAFTLAELLLCLGIIGVVSAMGMTIAKHGTDRAYNLFYYNGYINLYNAIADAKASISEPTNAQIMDHVNDLLSAQAANSINAEFETAQAINFLNLATYKAYSTNTTGGSQGYQQGNFQEVQDSPFVDTVTPNNPGSNVNDLINARPNINIDEINGMELPNIPGVDHWGIAGDDDEEGSDGDGGIWPGPDNAASVAITTSNGTQFYYPNNLEDNLNGLVGAAGATKAIPITMTIPQRKTRTNNGIATVRFVYVDNDNGYLIPIAEGSDVNLQLRRDLLPAYIDDGKVGRNNAINRADFNYDRIVYGSYRDAFCTIRNANGIGNLITCDGANVNLPPREGVLKIADPRKAR